MVGVNAALTHLLSLSDWSSVLGSDKSNLNLACKALGHVFPDQTFKSGEEVYDYESQNFWSNHQILKPACVFRPANAEDVAAAVLVASETASKFAVRGGGHMGIKGANSIDDGLLIVMSNLTTLELSDDKSSLWVGPGLDWGDVYSYLDPESLAVMGGRLSPVGVPGLLLGGGINFHGNQYGWSADNVMEYEIVFSTGVIQSVTADSNPDLFWALKGGSNNFGIVTKFRLRTVPAGDLYAGVYTVTDIDRFLQAVANFSAFNTDPLAHIVPQVVAADEETTVGAAILFYDSDLSQEPDCFRPFFDIPAVSNTFSKKRLASFAVETGALVTPKINDMFIAGTTVGKTYEQLLEGVKIVNDGFFNALPKLYEILPVENRVLLTVDWQPIGSLWAEGSRNSNPSGNPLNIDVESKGTYLAWAEVVEWKGEEYNDAVYQWIKETTWAIANATIEAGLYDPFIYMGDAAGFQEVYSGYGEENRNKLLQISQKYDPKRYFQTLWPGGFKIGS